MFLYWNNKDNPISCNGSAQSWMHIAWQAVEMGHVSGLEVEGRILRISFWCSKSDRSYFVCPTKKGWRYFTKTTSEFYIFIYWPCRPACGILVPRPGIEPGQWKRPVLTIVLPGNSRQNFKLKGFLNGKTLSKC